MGKRKRRQRAELPLFDLPLNPPAESPGSGPERLDGPGEPEPVAPEPAAPEPAAPELRPIPADSEEAARHGSVFESTDPASAEAPQLDLVDLGHEPGRMPERSTRPDGTAVAGSPAEGSEEEIDTRALPGDRLLGGFADLSVQVLMLGLAIASCHAMGIVVTLADWQPFAVLSVAFSFLYWIVPLAFWGQTPGMAWVGHTARSADGEPLTFGQTSRRWLGAVLTLALAGLPLLLALTGRSLTDRLSGSVTRSD